MAAASPRPAQDPALRARAVALRSALRDFESARRAFGLSSQEVHAELGGAIDDLRALLKAAGDTRAFRVRRGTTRRKAKA